MLNNIRVTYKILITFLIMFLIFLISIIYDLSAVSDISSTIDDFYSQPFTLNNKVKDVIIDLNQIHEYLREIMEETNSNIIIQKQILINNLQNQILDNLRIIEASFPGDDSKVEILKNAVLDAGALHNDIINNILNGDYEKANEIKQAHGSEIEEKIDQTTDEILFVADHYATRFMDEAHAIHKKQLNIVLYIGITKVFFIMASAYFLSKTISSPLMKLANVIESSDIKNESTILDITRKDEIGQVNKSYQQMIAKIQKREKQLRDSNRELEAFSYSVSHDLRAPLRHITGYINLMKKKFGEELSEEPKRYLNIVQAASEKMDLLISSLLEYSRTGRKELKKQLVNFDEMVNEIITEYKSEEKERTIEWIVNNLGDEVADQSLIKTVWENLIGNAYKYTSKEEKAIIEIGKYHEVTGNVFYVKDNGIGFDMEYYDKIFSVFQRLNNEADFKGVGIGLANVKRIISIHEGEVWATAKLGEGATFYFKLRK